MPLKLGRSTLLLPLVSAALLAGCTYGNVAPAAATVVVPTTSVPSAHAAGCRSNDDCDADHTSGICMPKPATKELSDAETFLAKTMRLHDLITSSSASQIKASLQQVRDDLSTYSDIASGPVPSGADGGSGAVAPRAPLTRAQMQQMQDAAWMQSGATQAEMLIHQLSSRLSTAPITTDAQKVYTDILGDSLGPHLDDVIRDLQTFLRDIEVAIAPTKTLVDYREPDGGVPGLKTGAGALAHYVGPLLKSIDDAMRDVDALLTPSAIAQTKSDVDALAQAREHIGKDGNAGTCLEVPRP